MSPIKSQELLGSVINKMEENIDVDEFFQTTLELLCEYISADGCLFLEQNIDLQSQLYKYYLSTNFVQGDDLIKAFQEISNFYHSSLISGNSIQISQEDQDLLINISVLLRKNNLESLRLLPIIYRNNYFGQLGCYWHNYSQPCSQEQLTVLQAIANQYAIFLYQKKLEEKLQQIEKEANVFSEKILTDIDYLSNISHELRTPISAIIGFSKMLNKQLYGKLNPKQLQYVSGIYDSGVFLLDLINDLLDISKIEAQKEQLRIEEISVQELCRASMSLVQEKAREQELNLILTVGTNVNQCLADKRRLKQILVNLLSNAVKFTERGSITLKVESKPKKLEFSVIDTGIGIKESEQKKLFKPFCQLNSHLHYKHRGTGLGLALSRKLARLHGGDINLISQEGKGSCFTLYLPLSTNNLEEF